MKTYRISEKELNGAKPAAVGYKIFNNDFAAQNGYDYKDENGNVIGTIHKVDGDIVESKWGLHFSEQPQDCFNFYAPLQWNKFAKVEAYGNIIRGEQKSVAQIIKIVETYSFDKFIRLIQKKIQSNGVNLSNGVNRSNGVNLSNGVNESNGVSLSNGVNESNGVNLSNGVNAGYGVNWSYGVDVSYGITKCEGISKSVFCYGKSGKLMLFNKKCGEKRYNEIYTKLLSFNWAPKFNNAEELKKNLEWYETYIPGIVSVPNEIAWSFMPKKMLEYIKSLPEFNEKVFEKVTGKIGV